MNVILAPHPDDELIGCYQLLIAGRVDRIVYVGSISAERRHEAMYLCESYNLSYRFLDGDIERMREELAPGRVIYMPSPNDRHALHQLIYLYATHIISHSEIVVYSVYMDDWFVRELSTKERRNKHEILDRFYPSQKGLWADDHRFFIFEGRVRLEL